MTETERQEIDRNLPALPDRALLRRVMPDDWRYGDVYGYTPKQMRMYGRKVWQAAKAREAGSAQQAEVEPGKWRGKDWRVGEFWRSSDPSDKCLVIAVDDEIAEYERHRSFIRWLPAPAPVVPEGWQLVPKSMKFDREAMENLLCMTGDSVAEDEFGECVLWVGETSDPDTGEKFYGLNAMLSEYPEEGSNPVILFDPPPSSPQPAEQERTCSEESVHGEFFETDCGVVFEVVPMSYWCALGEQQEDES